MPAIPAPDGNWWLIYSDGIARMSDSFNTMLQEIQEGTQPEWDRLVAEAQAKRDAELYGLIYIPPADGQVYFIQNGMCIASR